MQILDAGGTRIIRFDRRVDAVNARASEAQFEALLAGEATPTVLSLEQTEYISSAGLRLILTAGKKMPRQDLALACPPGTYVHEILETAGFTALFTVCRDEAEALKAVGRK